MRNQAEEERGGNCGSQEVDSVGKILNNYIKNIKPKHVHNAVAANGILTASYDKLGT